MDMELFSGLLCRNESEVLDLKSGQYSFEKPATEDDKSEILKDILAFANAWRDSDAYILIGVQEVRGGKAIVCGITKQLVDHELQQFVNSKTNRAIRFSHEEFSFQSRPCGVIHIPLQEGRPFYARNKFGKVAAEVVYVRRGSSTDIADPEEVARMGRTVAVRTATFKVRAEIRLIQMYNHFQIVLPAWLTNEGTATAYDVRVDFSNPPQGVFGLDHRLWVDKSGSLGAHSIISKEPIHPKDQRKLAEWHLGQSQMNREEEIQLMSELRSNPRVFVRAPVRYAGADIDMLLRIFVKDQVPRDIPIRFSRQEIEQQAVKDFTPA